MHTQLTLATRMVRPGCTPCAPAARTSSCRGAQWRRVVAQNRSCRRHRRSCRRCVVRSPERSVPRVLWLPPAVSPLYRDIAQRLSRASVTIRPFVSRPSPPIVRPLHGHRSLLRAGWSCRGPCWPYHGAGSVVSWPSPGRVVAPRLRPGHTSPSQCHDTIHCIMTQMGSSPFLVSAPFFFSKFFLFHSC